MLKKRLGLWSVLLFLTSACNKDANDDELANKPEYSILQSYEYKYRDMPNDKPYLVEMNALNTGLTVIAFPAQDKSHGYVVMLTNSSRSPDIKVLPDVDFVVTNESYKAVKEQIALSKEVDQFISKHIR